MRGGFDCNMNLTGEGNCRQRVNIDTLWEIADCFGNMRTVSMMPIALISVLRRSYFDVTYGTAAMLLLLFITSLSGEAHAMTAPSPLVTLSASEWAVGLSGQANMQNDSCEPCISFGLLGPPPDSILNIPPPPLPAFLDDMVKQNYSQNADCNLCAHFYKGESNSPHLPFPLPSVKVGESWLLILAVTVTAAAVLSGVLTLTLVKCKKWKIFPVTDACPILPESFLGHKGSSHSACGKDSSSADSSPVSIKARDIKDGSRKYWRRGSSQERPLQSGSPQCSEINSCCEEPYINQETTSCTDSPVYAELEGTPTTAAAPQPATQSCSPYFVHTYSDINNTANPIQLFQKSLDLQYLKDGAYDNAAFFATENYKFPGRLSRLDQSALCKAEGLVMAFPYNYPAAPILSLAARQKKAVWPPEYNSASILAPPLPPPSYPINMHNTQMTLTPKYSRQPKGCPANIILPPNLKELQKRPLPPVPMEHV